ncbi:MAG: hypothetical protein OEU32_11750 [Acidimicrobiia bacterium]|nr:hypothetical protein [Acidimicrobiia bacterium]
MAQTSGASTATPGIRWHRELSWTPGDLTWRIAALFMVGSFLFALGSFPLYAQNVDPGTVGVTFVVGSIFFTSAGYSQFLEVVNGADDASPSTDSFRFWAWQPNRILWWATAVQLVGTVLFNVNTIDAMIEGLDTEQTNRLVWAPDFFGSIAFLVASHLAWQFVCGRVWCVKRDDVDWWISALNYIGSIFFMLSAIAAFTLETTGETLNLTLVNVGTFVGAICFLIGAYLLLPPQPRS